MAISTATRAAFDQTTVSGGDRDRDWEREKTLRRGRRQQGSAGDCDPERDRD